ncbi:hypothetical protein [Paraglaciecola hydrolytica]|uniref:Uncharacterized protein n=1 Tax=Paraglaciecola hydrolytica TaxID=1799789 RepID=A0A136A6K0_9ALTE|nr:hypothetical protein [Paraglaciecola hydrolytica]KXI30858.1 hypothetical protein AX660_05500 [Paraglaciecola hydrolytica]
MNKFIGVVQIIGAGIWCLIMIPVVFFGILGRVFVTFPEAISSGDLTGIIIGILSVAFSFLMVFVTFKFGKSLIKSAMNKLKGNKSLSTLEIVKRERLAKTKT